MLYPLQEHEASLCWGILPAADGETEAAPLALPARAGSRCLLWARCLAAHGCPCGQLLSEQGCVSSSSPTPAAGGSGKSHLEGSLALLPPAVNLHFGESQLLIKAVTSPVALNRGWLC